MPKEFGLDAVLPNLHDVEARHEVTWTWEFDMTLRYWEFWGDEVAVGCNMDGRAACLGKTRTGNEIWVVIAPHEVFEEGYDIHSFERTRGFPRMDPTDYRVVMAMMAYMLFKSHYSDVYMTRDYPSIKDDAQFNLSTPLM